MHIYDHDKNHCVGILLIVSFSLHNWILAINCFECVNVKLYFTVFQYFFFFVQIINDKCMFIFSPHPDSRFLIPPPNTPATAAQPPQPRIPQPSRGTTRRPSPATRQPTPERPNSTVQKTVADLLGKVAQGIDLGKFIIHVKNGHVCYGILDFITQQCSFNGVNIIQGFNSRRPQWNSKCP